MTRAVRVAVLAGLLGLLGVAACRRLPQLGDPIDGLTRQQRRQFEAGRDGFKRVFTPETGLGPLFNADGCATCHETPIPGGSGDEVEHHVSVYDPAGPACDPLVDKGGPVIQQKVTPALKAARGIDVEPDPGGAIAGRRTTPDLFGFGLLDAVPDATLAALADPNDRNADGISGRLNRSVDGRVGRFGRKGSVPTLREFIAGAYAAEQGITTPDIPTEESIGGEPIPEGVDPLPEPEIDGKALDRTVAFVTFLAPPPSSKLHADEKRGRAIFYRIGCEACHVATLKTGDYPLRALRHRTITAYTDLLLHDMGPDLADICFGLATPSEFRTEPLMGLRLAAAKSGGQKTGDKLPGLLHDGRAHSIEEAVMLHGGEAAASRDRFKALTPMQRAQLLKFLEAL